MPDLQTARRLAAAHRLADTTTNVVKFFPRASADHVCLLEVSESAPATGEVLPFEFPSAPSEGIQYPSVVILLNPVEWASVMGGSLALPANWDLQTAQDV